MDTEKAVKTETKLTVDSFLASAERDANGKVIFSDSVSDDFKQAVGIEQRRRDLQATYTKTNKENKTLKAKVIALGEAIEKNVKPTLTAEQQQELADLRDTDVDAYISKAQQYEKEAAKLTNERITADVAKSVEAQEREARLEALEKLATNSGITMEQINMGLPPRIVNAYLDGDSDIDEFQKAANEYLGKGKVINKGTQPDGTPNVTEFAGSGEPSDEAKKESLAEDYATDVF